MDPNKKRKRTDEHHHDVPKKKNKSSQQFRQCYTDMWPCLIKSNKGDSFVRCVTCASDFSCAHGGRNDCKRHVQSKTHIDYADLNKNSHSLSALFTKAGNSQTKSHERQVTRAEVTMCEIVTHLNLPASQYSRHTYEVSETDVSWF